MSLTIRQLGPCFFGEVANIDLTQVHDEETLAELRAAMDEYGVLLFRDQPFTDESQLAFAQRFDGELHARTGISVLQKSRLGNEALTDISNLDENGEIMDSRPTAAACTSLGNRLWHTDASFQDPAGRYSMLHARVVPPVAADTEYADTRAAYDALPDEMKRSSKACRCTTRSPTRARPWASSSPQEEAARLEGRHPPAGAHHPGLGPQVALRRLARLDDHRLAGAGSAPAATRPDRARHAAAVPLPPLLARRRPRDLGQPRHACTAASPTTTRSYKRELRRVTTLDLPRPTPVAIPVIAQTTR